MIHRIALPFRCSPPFGPDAIITNIDLAEGGTVALLRAKDSTFAFLTATYGMPPDPSLALEWTTPAGTVVTVFWLADGRPDGWDIPHAPEPAKEK